MAERVSVCIRSLWGVLAAISLVSAQFGAAYGAASAVLIRDATLVDGTGAPARAGVDILIEGSVIRRIGKELAAPEATVVDASGKTVLPGLIDCHSHLRSVPGALMRGDDSVALLEGWKSQLRAYVAAGVTTVLDAAAPPSVLGEMRAYVERSNLGPRIEGLAPVLTPERGYFADEELRGPHYDDLWAPIGDDLSLIDAHLIAAAPFGPVGVKVMVEDGYGPFAVWPTFDDKVLAYIKEKAQQHRTPIFVHAIGADEYVRALKLEPYAFVHGGFLESVPDAETLALVKESGATVISTLAITDMILLIWQTERLQDPWLRSLVPARQLATAANASMSDRMIDMIARQNAPEWMPEFAIGLLTPWLFNEATTMELLDSALAAIKAMYDTGIPIVMGSDMGNWPVYTSLFHAVGSIREMELLETAGLPRQEVLVAATSRAATLVGRGEQTGTIEVGKRADLIIAEQNPLKAGMAAFRDLAFVMKNGELRTPEDWMTGPPY